MDPTAPPPDQWPHSLEVLATAIAAAVTAIGSLLGLQKYRASTEEGRKATGNTNEVDDLIRRAYEDREEARNAHRRVPDLANKVDRIVEQLPLLLDKIIRMDSEASHSRDEIQRRIDHLDLKMNEIIANQMNILRAFSQK